MFTRDKWRIGQHVSQARSEAVERLTEEERAAGRVVAGTVDANYGSTRPAEATVVDRVGAAKSMAQTTDIPEPSSRHERDLHRFGPRLVTFRRERDAAEKAAGEAIEERTKNVDELRGELRHHRYAGRWTAVLNERADDFRRTCRCGAHVPGARHARTFPH